MHHVMFDIDGTLVQSCDFDEEIYAAAVEKVVGFKIDRNLSHYRHVTDAGILREVIGRHGLDGKAEEIQSQVKKIFIHEISNHIGKYPVQEVPGASSFLNYLASLDNVVVSIATGGWFETAVQKLDAAGFHYSKEFISSSDDHFKRTEIMKTARAKHSGYEEAACTYFGDGIWDREACQELGFNFVLVGDRTRHRQMISDFSSADEVMAYIET